jgi:hypothetical protein
VETTETAEERDVKLMWSLGEVKEELEVMKAESSYDPRALAIAITYLETTMLWLANSRKK